MSRTFLSKSLGIMRIKNKGINDKTEDTVSDLIGYLILLKIALKENNDTK